MFFESFQFVVNFIPTFGFVSAQRSREKYATSKPKTFLEAQRLIIAGFICEGSHRGDSKSGY